MNKIYKKLTAFLLIFIILFISISIFWAVLKNKYPIKYKEEVLEYSREFCLPPLMVFSIIKAESNFNKKATSQKGAKGLMQIIDSTGEYIATKLKENYFDLYDVRTNVKYGCFYLRYLFDKFEDFDVVMSAYNAGEGNVYKWLKNKEYSINGKTLVVIPYKETKEYVDKVNKNFKIYTKIYADFVDKT